MGTPCGCTYCAREPPFFLLLATTTICRYVVFVLGEGVSPIKLLQRVFYDAVDIVLFQPQKVARHDTADGAWMAAVVLFITGAGAGIVKDGLDAGTSTTTTATLVIVIAAFIAFVAARAAAAGRGMQRIYTTAIVCGLTGIIYCLTAGNVVLRVLLVMWAGAALVYCYFKQGDAA